MGGAVASGEPATGQRIQRHGWTVVAEAGIGAEVYVGVNGLSFVAEAWLEGYYFGIFSFLPLAWVYGVGVLRKQMTSAFDLQRELLMCVYIYNQKDGF